MNPLYEITDLVREYNRGTASVRAVDGVDLTVGAGELLAIEGTSGSGKSTLLAMLGGLDRPTSGSIRFDGVELAKMSERELTDLRARELGFIFQGFNLIPTLTAQQNVEAVMAPLGLSKGDQRARALSLLERVGLAARAEHLPSLLSGGEQQRVAVARALANSPRVVLADEPTGNLDTNTANEVVALLRELTDDLGVTIILVTHDRELAAKCPRRIQMRDGRVVGQPRKAAAIVIPEVAALTAADIAKVVVPDNAAEIETVAAATTRPSWLQHAGASRYIGRAAAAIAVVGIGTVIVQSGSPNLVAALKDAQAKAPSTHSSTVAAGASVLPSHTTFVPPAKDATVLPTPKPVKTVSVPVAPVAHVSTPVIPQTAPTSSTHTSTPSKPASKPAGKPKPKPTASTPADNGTDGSGTTTTTTTPGWPTYTTTTSVNPFQMGWWWPWNWFNGTNGSGSGTGGN